MPYMVYRCQDLNELNRIFLSYTPFESQFFGSYKIKMVNFWSLCFIFMAAKPLRPKAKRQAPVPCISCLNPNLNVFICSLCNLLSYILVSATVGWPFLFSILNLVNFFHINQNTINSFAWFTFTKCKNLEPFSMWHKWNFWCQLIRSNYINAAYLDALYAEYMLICTSGYILICSQGNNSK